MDDVIERHLNDPGLGLLHPQRGLERAAEIDPVEAENDVGFLDRLQGILSATRSVGADVQTVVGRKGGAHLGVGDHARAEFLGKRHAIRPRRFAPRYASHHDERALGGEQHVERRLDLTGVDTVGNRRHVARRFDGRQLL